MAQEGMAEEGMAEEETHFWYGRGGNLNKKPFRSNPMCLKFETNVFSENNGWTKTFYGQREAVKWKAQKSWNGLFQVNAATWTELP